MRPASGHFTWLVLQKSLNRVFRVPWKTRTPGRREFPCERARACSETTALCRRNRAVESGRTMEKDSLGAVILGRAGAPLLALRIRACVERRDRGAERQSSRIVRSSSARRAGSARMSISTIFSPLTVKPPTEKGCPSRVARRPAAPLTSAGRTRRPMCE
jgi:hypothetical protein